MTRRVAVIGVGGVGMAHACAAGRLGLPVVAMIDADPATLARVRKRWFNTFDGHDEEVAVQCGCDYMMQVGGAMPDADVVIVAVPPHAQEALAFKIAHSWPRALVMFEKPVWLSHEAKRVFGDRLRMSAEHVHMVDVGGFVRAATSITATSTRTTATTRWGYTLNLLQDLGPHLFSLLYVHVGHPLKYGWISLTDDGAFGFSGRVRWDERDVLVSALRSPGLRFGWTLRGHTQDDGQWERRFAWQPDLFDRQLASPTCGIEPKGIEVIMALANGEARA